MKAFASLLRRSLSAPKASNIHGVSVCVQTGAGAHGWDLGLESACHAWVDNERLDYTGLDVHSHDQDENILLHVSPHSSR